MLQINKLKLHISFACIFFMCSYVEAQTFQQVHEQAIVCDSHNDIISTCIEKGYRFDDSLKGKTHSDLNRMKQAGIDVQVFSVWCDGTQQNPFTFANREIDTLYAWANRNPQKMMLVKTPADLRKAVKEKKLGAMIGVEGGHMIENDLNKLDSMKARGTCYLTLTWNNSNEWATSAKDETSKDTTLAHKGLTDFGKQLVQHMNDIGMMVDLSHTGEQTFWDVIHTTNKPVIVSHSCAYTLCPVPRNLKDDQIKAVAANGGVIQLNFYSGFLDSSFNAKAVAFHDRHLKERDSLMASGKPEFFTDNYLYTKYADEVSSMRAPFKLLMDHLNYIIKLAGIDHVGIGSDFDGISFPPQQMDDVTAMPLVTKALLEEGYSVKDVEKILEGNFIRVYEANADKN